MQERGWSRVRLFEEVGAELGYAPKSRSALLPLLIDKEPTPEQKIVLARHFGEPPNVAPEPATATEQPDPLVAAIDRQTAMLERVLNAILTRLPPTEDPETLAALAQVAEAERELLAERRGSGSPLRAPRPAGPGEEQQSTRRSGEKAG